MNFKELKNQIKEEQKKLASQIKNLKLKRKEPQYAGYISGLDWEQSTFRHKHIAYCSFFNKTPYEMIEASCYIPANTYKIEKYIKEWESILYEKEAA